LVAFPTETVYGIGANFLAGKAISRLYEVKKRPENKPFTIHISSVDTIREMRCGISPLADEFIKNFWPGPLTLILKSETGKLGFRMPENTVAKALISEAGVPVAAPSANISGEPPPTNARKIIETLDGKIDLILDAGETKFGKESTIVDTTVFPYKILRKGAVPEEEITSLERN
jgi:L-threonylcarbamoyladenylate synthase